MINNNQNLDPVQTLFNNIIQSAGPKPKPYVQFAKQFIPIDSWIPQTLEPIQLQEQISTSSDPASYNNANRLKFFTPEADLEQYTPIPAYKGLVIQLGEHGPQLVSPYVVINQICPSCKQQYGPLIYQLGHTAKTQHLLTCQSARLYAQSTNTGQAEAQYIQAQAVVYNYNNGPREHMATGPFLKITNFLPMKCYSCAKPTLDANLYYYNKEEADQEGARYLPLCGTCSQLHTLNSVEPMISPNWTVHYTTPDPIQPSVITFRKIEGVQDAND